MRKTMHEVRGERGSPLQPMAESPRDEKLLEGLDALLKSCERMKQGNRSLLKMNSLLQVTRTQQSAQKGRKKQRRQESGRKRVC